MKFSPLLIAGSLAANAILVVICIQRTRSHAEPATAVTASSAGSPIAPTAGKKPGAVTVALPPGVSARTWATLQTEDLRLLITRLRAAGFSSGVIRAIVQSRLGEKFRARYAALDAGPETPFWQPHQDVFGDDPKRRTALRALAREQQDLVRELLGPLGTDAPDDPQTEARRRRYGDLTKDKLDRLQSINDDYNDLRRDVTEAMRGITLPADRAKLALLDKEMRADLAAVLTPAELEDYELRNSRVTTRLQRTFTAMNATEDEFRTIAKIQLPYADVLYPETGSSSPEAAQQQAELQKQLAAQIKAALGDARYADYVRSNNREFQQLARFVEQAGAAPDTAVQAFALRDNLSQESNRIYNDSTLSYDQKKAALATLAQTTRTQLTTTLGVAAPDYLKVAERWLGGLERGGAVTFAEAGGQSIKLLKAPRPAKASQN